MAAIKPRRVSPVANIVLLAATGQVGYELAKCLGALGALHCISRSDVDFTDTVTLIDKISALKPAVIVNAAAWTAVDLAQTEQSAAYQLNADLPAALATLGVKLDAWLVHYSTDYVYAGDGDSPWQEDDAPAPLSVYGASKLAGDNAIVASGCKHLIFRTSWVYAGRGKNFMLTMLNLAKRLSTLNVVSDQIGAPTPAALIAQTTLHCLARVMADGATAKHYSGIYHLASKGYTSWYQFAQAIFTLARQHGVALQLSAADVVPVSTAQYPTAAKRPANSRLNVDKIERTFAVALPNWHSALEQTFSAWLASASTDTKHKLPL